ncbi:MAG: hypothetical protein U9R66_14695 [Thermodesulfobacteriota bacterium]|nr:hypothetical protein [Thermodesulfobacteriota bacterium]
MKQRPQNTYFFLLFLFVGLLAAACAPKEVKPPLKPGKFIAQGGTSESALSIGYSVSRFEEQLNVIGDITNTNLTDLDFVKLDLTVTTLEGNVVAKGTSGTLFIPENESRTFAFSLPLLHGTHLFQCSYEYDYYDYRDNDLRGSRTPRLSQHKTGSFEDRIELP